MCKVCEMVKDNEKHVIRKKLNRQIFIILRFVDCTSKTFSCCFIKFITLLNRCLWYFLKIIWRKELLGLLVLQENNWVIRELKWESLHCDRPNIDWSLLTFPSLALHTLLISICVGSTWRFIHRTNKRVIPCSHISLLIWLQKWRKLGARLREIVRWDARNGVRGGWGRRHGDWVVPGHFHCLLHVSTASLQ